MISVRNANKFALATPLFQFHNQTRFHFCYNQSKKLFNRLSSASSQRARWRQKSTSQSIAACSDFTDLSGLYCYYAEDHVVHTVDSYLLGIHRLPYRKTEDHHYMRVNAGQGSITKPVVYLHHGLLMNSEVWVCLTEEQRCLPFALRQKYLTYLPQNGVPALVWS